MKKLFLLAMPLLLAACGTDTDEPAQFTTKLKPLNLVATKAEAVISQGEYEMIFYPTENKLDFAAVNLAIAGSKMNFTWEGLNCSLINGEYKFQGSAYQYLGHKMSNLSGLLTARYNAAIPNSLTTNLVCSFTIDDTYAVKTFPANAYYTGTTAVDYEMQGEKVNDSYTNPYYFVQINPETLKATVHFFNFQVAAAMPQLNFTLSDLTVEPFINDYGTGAYRIKGENVVPVLSDGSPNSKFVFNQFELNTLGEDLTSVIIEFTCAGKYHGLFSGSYLGATAAAQ